MEIEDILSSALEILLQREQLFFHFFSHWLMVEHPLEKLQEVFLEDSMLVSLGPYSHSPC